MQLAIQYQPTMHTIAVSSSYINNVRFKGCFCCCLNRKVLLFKIVFNFSLVCPSKYCLSFIFRTHTTQQFGKVFAFIFAMARLLHDVRAITQLYRPQGITRNISFLHFFFYLFIKKELATCCFSLIVQRYIYEIRFLDISISH